MGPRLASGWNIDPEKEVAEGEPIGRQHPGVAAVLLVRQALDEYKIPTEVDLQYGHIDRQAGHGAHALHEGVIMVKATLQSRSGPKHHVDIPVVVHKGRMLTPAIVVQGGFPRVLTQNTIDDILSLGEFSQPMPERKNMYAPPPDKDAASGGPRPRLPRIHPGMFAVTPSRTMVASAVRGYYTADLGPPGPGAASLPGAVGPASPAGVPYGAGPSDRPFPLHGDASEGMFPELNTGGDPLLEAEGNAYCAEHGHMCAMDHEAKAPPGREKQVRRLKQTPGVDNPYAVAWSSYNKSAQAGSGTKQVSRALSAVQMGRWDIAQQALTDLPDWELQGVPRKLIEGLRMEVRGEARGIEGRSGMPLEVVQAIKTTVDKWARANPSAGAGGAAGGGSPAGGLGPGGGGGRLAFYEPDVYGTVEPGATGASIPGADGEFLDTGEKKVERKFSPGEKVRIRKEYKVRDRGGILHTLSRGERGIVLRDYDGDQRVFVVRFPELGYAAKCPTTVLSGGSDD
jgi:hypothetical protein